MSTVVADMSVSLDGFVADPAGGVDRVFAWYGKPQPAAQPVEPIGQAAAFGLRVIVYGRRTFDQAKGWNGQHPTRAPVIVVTHEVPDGWPRKGSTASFVTSGVESALREAEAGDLAGGPVELENPTVVEGNGVTHLHYAVSERQTGS
jgi:dihydrofolate reductase